MLPLENITVGSLLRRSAALYANRPAVICHDTVCTYRELDAAVDRFAAALISAGISHGDHVGLFGEIEKESLALFFAVQRIGAVAVLLNTALVAEASVRGAAVWKRQESGHSASHAIAGCRAHRKHQQFRRLSAPP